MPLSTPGGLEKTSPIQMLQEPAISLSRTLPNLWSMLPAAQVNINKSREISNNLMKILLNFTKPGDKAKGAGTVHDAMFQCVSEFSDAEGQGYCQGGFSADFTTVITTFCVYYHFWDNLFPFSLVIVRFYLTGW